MTRLVMLDPHLPERLDRLRPYLPAGWEISTAASRSPEDQISSLTGAQFAITGDVPVTAQMMALSGLVAVHKWGVGYDNIDLDAAKVHGVKVLRTTGANAVTVAESTLGLILAVTRNLARGYIGIQDGKWRKGEVAPSSMTLSGRTVGIIGFGSIGRAVAKLLTGFGCTVLYTKRSPLSAEEDMALGVSFAPLPELLARADVVTLNCELNESTRNLINRETLAQMKRGSILVNVARGGVVVEADLAEAVTSGHLRGAAVDVFSVEPILPDNPLIGIDRVLLTPHLAAISADSFIPGVKRMMANFLAIHEGRAPRDGDQLV